MIWTPEAIEDVERLHEDLRVANPRQATDAMVAVRLAASQLEANPESGPAPAIEGAPHWLRHWPFAIGGQRFMFSYRQSGGDTVVLTVRMTHDNDDTAR